VPLVSVLMSVHNDARFVAAAVQSVLDQTLDDLELIVVDDASTDETPDVLAAFADARLEVLRNDVRSGLAASLNRGLDAAQGAYAARLDSDDVARADRLERQVARIRTKPRVAVVGSAVRDLDEAGRSGALHLGPRGPRAVRWLSLFSSPFFHPTVLVDRARLDELGFRYDTSYGESEDYDLWTRLLAHADGANLAEPLVLKRVHPGQASQRRGDVQESFQRQVALREIARLAPEVDAERAWRVGARKAGGSRREYVRLLRAFDRVHGRDGEVLGAAARAVFSPRRRG
jgi:glycosyltransferase involved in cell wall biosynthesis